MTRRLNGITNGNGGDGSQNHLTRRTIPNRRLLWDKLPGATARVFSEHINGGLNGHRHPNHRNRKHVPNGMISHQGNSYVVIQSVREGVYVVEEVLGMVVRGGPPYNLTPKTEQAEAAKDEREYFEHAPGTPKEKRAYWVYVPIDEAEARRVKVEYNAKLPARKEPVVGSEAF